MVCGQRNDKQDRELTIIVITDWYDNEHCPPRLTLDGWLIGNRYKSTDSQKPTWLTVYDLATHEIGNSPEFQALMAPENTSEREKEIMGDLWGSQRALWSTLTSDLSDISRMHSVYRRPPQHHRFVLAPGLEGRHSSCEAPSRRSWHLHVRGLDRR